MTRGRPADYRDVVHPRRMDTAVYIAAEQPPCIRLQQQAARPKSRDHRTERLGALADVDPPERWLLAVILCPGDTTDDVVQWLRAHGDPDRVVFFLHPDTDPVAALKAWYDAGHPDPVAYEAKTWKQLAAQLGRFVNDWIYVDAKGSGWPL